MKNKKAQFAINEFTNPSGKIVWRVYGRKRDENGQVTVIRENYPVYAQALARRGELEIEAFNQIETKLILRPTRLGAGQLAEAESAVLRLNKHTIGFAVDFFLRNYKPGNVEITVEKAFEEFIAAKTAKKLRADSLRCLRSRVGNLKKAYGPRLVSEIQTRDIEAALNKSGWSPRQVLNERRSYQTFFLWASKQKYCAQNPVAAIDPPKVELPEPAVLALSEVRRLLQAAVAHKDGCAVPGIALSLFAGLRPKEVTRITWDDLDLQAKTLTIGASIAKVRARRIVELSDTLVAWLLAYRNQPLEIQRRDWNKIRKAAGFSVSAWQADVMRHTAISNKLAECRNDNLVAAWAGNSPNIVHRNYKALIKTVDAAAFWTILPGNLSSEIITVAAA